MNEWIRSINVRIFTSARVTLRCSVKSCSLPRARSVSELLCHRPEPTCQKIRLQRQLLYIRKPKLTHWLSLNRAELAVTVLPQDHSKLLTGHLLLFSPPRRNPSDDLRYTFRRKSARNLSPNATKRIPWLSTRDVSLFSPQLTIFTLRPLWEESVERKESFIPWNSPSFLMLTKLRTDG